MTTFNICIQRGTGEKADRWLWWIDAGPTTTPSGEAATPHEAAEAAAVALIDTEKVVAEQEAIAAEMAKPAHRRRLPRAAGGVPSQP